MTATVVPAPVSFNTANIMTALPESSYTNYPFQVIEAAPEMTSWYASIWSWVTLDMSHIAITLLAVALLFNLYQNEKRQQAHLSILTALFAIAVSFFAVWLNYNVWVGSVFVGCFVWFLTQSSRFSNIDKDEVEDTSDVPSAVPQPQPQPSVYANAGSFDSYVPSVPSTGISIGLNLRNL